MNPDSLTPPNVFCRCCRFRALEIALILALFSLYADPASAHRLTVFAYLDGEEIQVESYFSRGSPCRGCSVEVFDSSDTVLQTGETSDEGVWRFKPANPQDLRVVVSAGEGHRGEYTIPGEELQTEPRTETESPLPRETPEISATDRGVHPGGLSAKAAVLSETELEKIVSNILDEKLSPIRRSLAQLEVHEPGLTEVLGGIGYIIGIFGTAAFFMSRWKPRE